jgi:hypothetical protein
MAVIAVQIEEARSAVLARSRWQRVRVVAEAGQVLARKVEAEISGQHLSPQENRSIILSRLSKRRTLFLPRKSKLILFYPAMTLVALV